MNILQVVASLKGGAARHVFHLSRQLLARGRNVEIAAPSDNPALETEICRSGVPLLRIRMESSLPLSAVRLLRRHLKNHPYTHVHLHGHRAAFITRLAMLGMRKTFSVLYTLHGYHPLHYSNRWTKWSANFLEQCLRRHTDEWICVSADTEKELLQAVPGIEAHCHVIENGIPLRSLSPEARAGFRVQMRSRLQIPENHSVIGTVARLHRQKGVDRLLRALPMLKSVAPDFLVLIIGDGPEREALEALSNELQVMDQCRFLGEFGDVYPWYCAMDLFVLPSLWEGLPLTILEAWDVGVPVVATRVSGVIDLIEDGVDGFLADSSPEGIARGILAARQSENRLSALIENARQKLIRRYSLERMVEQMEDLYLRTLPPQPLP